MLFSQKNASPKYANFSISQAPYITSHSVNDGKTRFKYSIFVDIDKSKISTLEGDLQIRAFTSQRSRPPISVKKSDVASSNFLKKIDRQRMQQIAQGLYEKKYFSTLFIDRPDLGRQTVSLDMEVPSAYVDSRFSIDLVNVKSDGSYTIIDSTEVDHSYALQQYDIPSVDFSLTVTRSDYGKIYAAASTSDSNVGSFRFLLRKDTDVSFVSSRFEKSLQANLGRNGIAEVEFEVEDCDQTYTVLASPISLILGQEIGNFKTETLGFKRDVKQIPFYIASINNSTVSFSAESLDGTVSKIMLFRQRKDNIDREFVDCVENPQLAAFISDKHRNPQYDYIYSFDYIDKQGITNTSSSRVVVPALKLDTLAKIRVSQIAKQDSQSFIVFNCEVDYNISTTFDKIVEDLKSLGLENLLSTDLEKTTNNLKPLVRVLVSRISTKTGEEIDLGVFPPGEIKIRKNITTSATDEKYIYRFEVAVRSVPETLETLTSAQKVIADNSFNLKSANDLSSKIIGNRAKTGKTNFSAKFFTRSSIRGSELRYGEAADLSDLGFYSGRTGIFTDITTRPSQIRNLAIKNLRFATRSKGSYLTWSASQISDAVDFFEINIDGLIFYSYPTSKPLQIFHLGNLLPKTITIAAMKSGKTLESGAITLKVRT